MIKRANDMDDTVSLTDAQARWLRLRHQLLYPSPAQTGQTASCLVAHLVGVQAQYSQAAALALRARSRQLTQSKVQRALIQDRTIVRTWCLRGTLHLVAAEDLGWLLKLIGPSIIAGSERRFQQLGIDNTTRFRAIAAIEERLASLGPLTRSELFGELQARGVDTSGQRGIHFLGLAGLQGKICPGPVVDSEVKYVLSRDWLPKVREPRGDAALAELARRYLAAYGPAEPRDLATWSGLPAKSANAAWKLITGEIYEVSISGRRNWLLTKDKNQLTKPAPASLSIKLLAAFDAYLMGYKDRALAVDPAHTKDVNAGGGLLRPVAIVDGQTAATWTMSAQGKRMSIQIEPFSEFRRQLRNKAVTPGLQTEANDIGRFLGMEIELSPLP